MKGVEQTNVKYTHSGHTLRHPFEHQLIINNEKQNCKIDTVEGVLVRRRRVNEGD
jgi:hypothetical protein